MDRVEVKKEIMALIGVMAKEVGLSNNRLRSYISTEIWGALEI